MEMTKKEFSTHFSDAFTPEIKAFGRETLLVEGFDCLIVTDREDKEKAYCTHCKKWVKIPGNTVHTGSPKSIQAAERRNYNMHCCHGPWGMTEAEIEMEKADEERRQAIEERKHARCPECQNVYSVYHQWRMVMGQLDGFVSISVWAKSKVEKGAVVMRRIEIHRHYGNDADNVVKDTIREAERYLFRMGHKTVRQDCRPNKEYVYNKGKGWRLVKRRRRFIKSIIDRAVRESTVMWTDYVKGRYRMDIGSLKAAIRNTQYQYLFIGAGNYISNYKRYPYRDSYPLYTVNLMDLYSLHPWIELLMKNSMMNIVIDHVRGIGCSGAICWAAKSIKRAVKRYTKQDMKDVLNINAGQKQVTEHDLAFLANAREMFFPKLTLAEAMDFVSEGLGTLENVCKKAKDLKLNPEKVIAYCRKQRAGALHQLGDWLDYLADAEKIGLDLTQESNALPKDLHTMHAHIVLQIKYQHDKELEEKLKSTLAARNELFRWKGKKYFIRPAESAEELVAEGKVLHHCVGGYAARHATGETTILFVRENTAPDKPLYTMEVQGNKKDGWKMAQIRGYMNCNPPKEVRKMVKQFMERVNSKGKAKKVRIRVA